MRRFDARVWLLDEEVERTEKKKEKEREIERDR